MSGSFVILLQDCWGGLVISNGFRWEIPSPNTLTDNGPLSAVKSVRAEESLSDIILFEAFRDHLVS